MAKKEKAELTIIEHYLPQQMTREEIVVAVDKLKASGLNDFQSLIKEAMKELKGKADGKMVTEIIKECLQ